LGSAFASDTIGAFDDRVLLTAGLRLQAISVTSYSYTDGRESGRYAKDAVTPVVGLVVKPLAGLSLYANRIEGLSQGPSAPTDATLINSGEVFAPFKSTQYEVGGKLAIGRFNASLAAYTITLPSAYAMPDPQGSGLLRYGVYGEQRNRGLEFAVDGEIARGLRLIAGATVVDAELRRQQSTAINGRTAVGVPDYTANANVEWDLPFVPGLTLTGRVVQTGKQQVNAANTLSIPDWTRVDLGARAVMVVADRPLTLRVNVDNVANARYWASSFDSFGQALLQGQPRTAKASLSMDF
jgi:iron complex outermembrane receptor protein